ESLWRWSAEGKLPIVCDASSCSFGLASEIGPYLDAENRERHAALTILDSVAWAHDHLLPKLSIRRKAGAAVIHPSCSAAHLGLGAKLQAIATALADKAVTPSSAGCCGFAGDR